MLLLGKFLKPSLKDSVVFSNWSAFFPLPRKPPGQRTLVPWKSRAQDGGWGVGESATGEISCVKPGARMTDLAMRMGLSRRQLWPEGR